MRIKTRAATALLAATIVVGGSATAAHAASTTVKDKASDVLSYADLSQATGTTLSYADSVASGADVRSLKVKHGKKSVTVTMKFAQLKSGTAVSVAFRPSGSSQPTRVFINTGRKTGEVYDMKDKTRCSAPITTKRGKGGSVTTTIKRSCLGNPKKIKVSAAAVHFDMGTNQYLIDAVSRSSVKTPTETKWLKAS